MFGWITRFFTRKELLDAGQRSDMPLIKVPNKIGIDTRRLRREGSGGFVESKPVYKPERVKSRRVKVDSRPQNVTAKPVNVTANKKQLISALFGNVERAEALVQLELNRKPSLSYEQAIQWALDRLERDRS